MHRKLFNHSSEAIDEYFGLDINSIEDQLLERGRLERPQGKLSDLGAVLHEGNQTWIGLHPQVLNTPYEELVHIADLLNPSPEDIVVDLGAAYGRLGLVLHSLYPGVEFKGLEYVQERVNEGNRVFRKHSCDHARIFQQDLSDEDFILPEGNFYFLYDFGQVAHIRSVLKKIEKLADEKKFEIVARGKGTRSMIDHEFLWLTPRVSRTNYSIYYF